LIVLVLVCHFCHRYLVCFIVLPRRSCRVILREEIFGCMLHPFHLDRIGFLIPFYKVLMAIMVGPMLGQSFNMTLGMRCIMRLGLLLMGSLGRLGLVHLMDMLMLG
ncbi:hypothetical protein ES288_D01G186300v1, partial [Gossypium darwinii]